MRPFFVALFVHGHGKGSIQSEEWQTVFRGAFVEAITTSPVRAVRSRAHSAKPVERPAYDSESCDRHLHARHFPPTRPAPAHPLPRVRCDVLFGRAPLE